MRGSAVAEAAPPPRSERRNCPVALAVVLIAFLGVLALTLAPTGMFVSAPGVTHADP